MSIKLQCNRSGCKDIFKAFMLKNAKFDGKEEIPIIKGINDIPNKVISFIAALKSKDYNKWIHFYIDDFHFDKVWNNINRYVDIFKKFNGVILPDFSVYRDMPLIMQYWNIFRSRTIGVYLQSLCIKVIVNVRYGDERTYEIACLGISKHQTIAIGTNGAIQNKVDRKFVDDGFDNVIKKIEPRVIIIYGGITKHIKDVCENKHIQIVNFQNDQYERYGGN